MNVTRLLCIWFGFFEYVASSTWRRDEYQQATRRPSWDLDVAPRVTATPFERQICSSMTICRTMVVTVQLAK